MKEKKKLEPVNEKTVEGITHVIVIGGALVGLYYLAVFADWIEPLF